MALPLTRIDSIPQEILEYHILSQVMDPAVTGLVSKSWNEATNRATNSELKRIWMYLNPNQNFQDSKIPEVKALFHKIIKDGVATDLPPISMGRFDELSKIHSTLTFWKSVAEARVPEHRLPPIPKLKSFESIDPLKIEEEFNNWIDQNQIYFPYILRLDISSSDLFYLPPQIDKLTELRLLNVGGNHLRSLPQEITGCTHLQELYIEKNSFSNLPLEVLSQLPEFRALDARENPFTEAPNAEEVKQSLQLMGLRLEAIPEPTPFEAAIIKGVDFLKDVYNGPYSPLIHNITNLASWLIIIYIGYYVKTRVAEEQ